MDDDLDDDDDDKPSRPEARKGQGQRENRPQGGKRPRGPKQSQGAVATGAVAVLGTMAGAQGAIQDGLFKGVTREVAGRAATALPDRYLRPLRGISHGVVSATVIAAPVATGVIARALGASPGVRGVVTDLTADFFGTVGERLTGQPHSEKSKSSARTGLEGKKEELAKLKELRDFAIVQGDIVQGGNVQGGNVQGGNDAFHHRACVALPHPKDKTAKIFYLTLDQVRDLRPEREPPICCEHLVTKYVARVAKLEKEIEEMESPKKPKTFPELMATEEGRRVNRWIHECLERQEIVSGRVHYADGREVEFEHGVMEFLRSNLDEDELPMLASLTMLSDNGEPAKDELIERLELIRNKAKHWTTVRGAYGEGKKLFDKANAAVDISQPLQQANAKLAQAGSAYQTWLTSQTTALFPAPPPQRTAAEIQTEAEAVETGAVSDLAVAKGRLFRFVEGENVFHDPDCPTAPPAAPTDHAFTLDQIQALRPVRSPATCCEGLISAHKTLIRQRETAVTAAYKALHPSLLTRIKNWW